MFFPPLFGPHFATSAFPVRSVVVQGFFFSGSRFWESWRVILFHLCEPDSFGSLVTDIDKDSVGRPHWTHS